jgi:ABC-type transport system involved in multi-copper enzyme maturation permease subunit
MNPIIRRELLEWLRTRQALALQVGLAMACALLVLVRWPTGGVSELTGARSQEVLRVFGYSAMIGIIFLVPALPATTLVRERVQGTLALLLNSPLPGWSIYLGKLGGAVGFTILLLVMTLPAAAACYTLGGTSVEGGIALLYIVLALASLHLTTLGLLVSSRAQSTDGALRVTYGLVLFIYIIPLGVYWLFQGLPPPWSNFLEWFRCLSPVPAVMEVIGQSGIGSHGMVVAGGAVMRYLVLGGAMSLIFATATMLQLNQAMLDRARPPGVMTQDRPLVARIIRRLIFLVDPSRRARGIHSWVNPVMAKEFLFRRFGRSHWMLRLIAVSAIVSLGLSCVAATGALGWGLEYIGGALVLLQITLLILFAPSLGAGLISAERESGGWQLLLMTPLSPGAILRGKLVSVAWPLFLLLCATLPGYVVMMSIKTTLAEQIQRVVISLVLTGVFAVLVSAVTSSLFRSTAVATTVSYAVLLAVSLGPLLIWLLRGAPFGHRAVEAALTLSPVAGALNAAAFPLFINYSLVPVNWWIIGGASLALMVVLIVRTWQLYRPE